MGDLLFNLMNKFCKNGSVYEDSMSSIKSTGDLVEVDVTLQKTQKSAKNIDIGTKTKLLLIESSLSDAEKLSFRGECLKFYAAAVTYLQDNLPFKVSLIKHTQYLYPEKRSDSNFTRAISNLCLTEIV